MFSAWFLLLILSSASFAPLHAQPQVSKPAWGTIPFSAPAIPLAVKSPHLQAWLPQGSNPLQNGATWPTFWNQPFQVRRNLIHVVFGPLLKSLRRMSLGGLLL